MFLVDYDQMAVLVFFNCLAILVALLLLLIVRVVEKKYRKSLNLRKHYEKQGILGPAFRPFFGNLPEIQTLAKSIPSSPFPFNQPSKLRAAPEFWNFLTRYGKVSVHEVGCTTRLVISDNELAKQVLISKAPCYQKADLSRETLNSLLGKGVVLSDGELWRQQRQILNPAFKLGYLKGLVKHIVEGGEELVNRWKSLMPEKQGPSVEIEIYKQMSMMTMDIITRASFGSSLEGNTPTSKASLAFESLLDILNSRLATVYSYIRFMPGYRWLPIPQNLRMWKREKCVNKILKDIIQKRLTSGNQGQDLLGMMLHAMVEGSPTMSMNQLMDESKTIFFAGHATTALLLTWSLVMLSKHQDWQEKARQEAREHFLGDAKQEMENLGKLQIMSLILKETLRLYPPVVSISRTCCRAHEIGDISIIPGTTVVIPLILLQQSEETWGGDASAFNPARFKEKKDVVGFMPFGGGPRICLGMNFAMMEAKVLLATLLHNFHFSLSPNYKHAPGHPLGMRPYFGAPLLVRPLSPPLL